MGGNKKEKKEKPLDKLTAKDLRELAKEIPQITGVHGMNKIELINEIKKARGIEDQSGQKDTSTVRDLKKKIKELKIRREKAITAADQKMADIYRSRIIRLKKKTRKI